MKLKQNIKTKKAAITKAYKEPIVVNLSKQSKQGLVTKGLIRRV
jgi:hypothetical protein